MTHNEILLRRAAADIARSDERVTKKAARAAIKGLKFQPDGQGYAERVDRIYELANEFRATRTAREDARRLADPQGISREATLREMKRHRFLACVQRCGFKQTENGCHDNFVKFVDCPDKVRAIAWAGPAGLRTGDNRVDTEHRFFILPNWTADVEQRGLALLDGKLTLHAGPFEEAAGVQVFPAVWAAPGVAFAVATYKGYVARNDGFVVHAATREEAVKKVGGRRRLA